MSWHSTYSPIHPGCEDRPDPKVDRLARELAADAGDDWDRMNAYPGFERNGWRATAERALARTGRD
jgi:hypothetical protein